MPRNLGYAAAMNRGLDLLRGDGLDCAFLFTHEVRLGTGALQRALEALERDAQVAAVGFALDQGPDGTSWGSQMLAGGGVGHIRERPPGEVASDVPWIDGSAMLLRLSALTPDIELPEKYFMYFEEAWVCMALRRGGWRVVTALDAMAFSQPGYGHRGGPYGYLFSRNGTDWAREFYGRGAALRFARAQAMLAWRQLPKPGGRRFRDRAIRRQLLLLCGGRLLGLAAALAGRWGAPPRWLLRGSDIAQT